MIKGITHDEDGNLKEKIPIIGRVTAGKPPDEDRNYPVELDHFVIKKRKQIKKDVEWVEDKELMAEIDENSEPNEIKVALMYDDLESNLRSSLQWWKGRPPNGFLKCFGDGDTAQRWDEAKEERFERSCPCPQLEDGNCTPNGQLKFILLEEEAAIGGAHAFYTNSSQTIRQLYTNMNSIKEFTDGRLKGVPLRLGLQPENTKYRDQNDKERQTVHYYAYLSLNVNDLDSDVLDRVQNKIGHLIQSDVDLDVGNDSIEEFESVTDESEEAESEPTPNNSENKSSDEDENTSKEGTPFDDDIEELQDDEEESEESDIDDIDFDDDDIFDDIDL